MQNKEHIKLPKVLSQQDLSEWNQKLLTGNHQLDWSLVEKATEVHLATLLVGLDLTEHAEALGLDTIPEALFDAVEKALTQPKKRTKKSAQPTTTNTAPSTWTPAPDENTTLPAPAKEPTTILKAPSHEQLRQELEELVVRDLLGPAGGFDEEVSEDSVRNRYLLGTLAPRRQRIEVEEIDDLDVEEFDDGQDGSSDEGTPPSSASMFPSSIGISFCVPQQINSLRLIVRWGKYERKNSTITNEDGSAKKVWKRKQIEGIRKNFTIQEGIIEPWIIDAAQPDVKIQGVVRSRSGNWLLTLFLVNNQQEQERRSDERWLFQPEIVVESPSEDAIFCRRQHPLHDNIAAEEKSMSMLYRNIVEFAVGHGVGVRADTLPTNPQRAVRLSTKVAPRYEVAKHASPGASEIPELQGLVLDMKELAETATAELPNKLRALPEAYQAWIQARTSEINDPARNFSEYRDVALLAMERCSIALTRIQEGIQTLLSDEKAAEAFRFANQAMHQQRLRSLYSEKVRRGQVVALSELDVPQNRTWHVFQLAFLLLSLTGVTRFEHPDRTSDDGYADLLWFPTGGGKTEAYLGLAAYTMGIRRLQGVVGGRAGEYGLSVLMRYTLRLLTLQQFQRASALICACEMIRREAPAKWGREPFRIGLWVGQKTTPNKTKQSDESIKESRGAYKQGSAASGVGSPAQLTNCPWCGVKIDPGKHIQVNVDTGRTLIYCGDSLGRCPFTPKHAPTEGLPLVVVDEEIYRLLPTMLIATVDKFAQMPWNGAIQTLFGTIAGKCGRHGFRSPELEDADSHPKKGNLEAARTDASILLPRPPDLIIQDELHLISGPLGTITGLFETAIDALCSWELNGKTIRPKVVASTATIRRANEQINSLFLRKVFVFPPHGTDATDSFFAKQQSLQTVPGRVYLGVCAPGRRLKAALIRVYVSLLAAGQLLYTRYGKSIDPWMTLVGYFNSLRELAGMRRLVEDDVRSRLRDAKQRGLENRPAPIVEELTSRKGSTDIPEILDRVEEIFDGRDRKEIKGRYPLDVLLATNMISVGVDVKRLGLMVVGGQPKNTAEYIQATSRVGRSFPGLVVTVLNWSRPRDLSHYERFEQYHATFYQHVEALSLTPFAPRALDRALTSVFVSLVRLMGIDMNPNDSAQSINPQHPNVQKAISMITARAQKVTGSSTIAAEVNAMLQTRLRLWTQQASRNIGTQLGYKTKRDGQTRALLRNAGDGLWDEFTCLYSMRDVEPSVNLVLKDGGLDEEPTATTQEAQ